MISETLETKTMQMARALSNQTIARTKVAATILGITTKHLIELAKQPGFPPKIKIGANAVGWRVCDLENWIDSKQDNAVTVIKGENDAS